MRRTLQECNAVDAGRRAPRLFVRMSRTRRGVGAVVKLFASAVVRLATSFGGRLYLVVARRRLSGRMAMPRRRRAMIRHRNRPADQLFDVAKKRQLLCVAERDRRAGRAGARGAAD